MQQELTGADVRRLIDAGMSVERLERLLELVDLDADEKSALWLRAWSRRGRQEEQHRVPALYLG